MAEAGLHEVMAVSREASPSRQAWVVWSLAVMFVLFLFGFQTGYSVVNPSIKTEFGLTVAQVGLVAATYTWSFAVFQMFSGALLDQLGARRVLLPAIALVTTGVLVFATATTFPAIIGSQLILALGACAGFVGAGYVGGQWFGMEKFSVMFGLVQCFASLFSAFSQNLLTLALRFFGWRRIFMGIGIVGVLLFVVAVRLLRDPDASPRRGLDRGVGRFLADVLSGIMRVARVGHVWMAAGYGALVFGVLLAAGVVWAPKLMLVRGVPEGPANLAASVLWIGVALGCVAFPRWSDAARSRKLPTLIGIALQLGALIALLYTSDLTTVVSMVLWFAFGFGGAAHMLAFSAAGDAVKLEQIGTSAAIVNGTMFVVGGLLIARPGQLAGHLIESGLPISLELARGALRPLAVALLMALLLAAFTRESHPASGSP